MQFSFNGINISWQDLQTISGIELLDKNFCSYLENKDQNLYIELQKYRSGDFSRSSQSAFILNLAPILEEFWLLTFNMSDSYVKLQNSISEFEPVLAMRKWMVRAMLTCSDLTDDEFHIWHKKISNIFADNDDHELALAKYWQKLGEPDALSLAGYLKKTYVEKYKSLQKPKKINFDELFAIKVVDNFLKIHACINYRTQDFNLTDDGGSLRDVMLEVDYCLYCHKNQNDSCSLGLLKDKFKKELGVKKNAFGDDLEGCPLDQHISEMNLLRRRGYAFASLACVMVENPLCALTGHRICNDCRASCIYQKQESVDIPKIETRILRDILLLDYGVEWYLLLLRWNPLRSDLWAIKKKENKNILVMGLGPSGIASLYYLTMAGFNAVGFDGSYVKNVDDKFIKQPIYAWSDCYTALSKRDVIGFGGVAEYGITSRWDKNFLTLLWIAFARMRIETYGCIRFGGTFTVDDIWLMGFDHLVLALGAGLPENLNVKNGLALGVKSANDFLMNLHLGLCNRDDSLNLIDIRLPAVVVGGGLTSVDAATELQAYYVHLCKRVYYLIEKLLTKVDNFWSLWSDDEENCLRQWYSDGLALQECSPGEIIKKYGGANIVYRKDLQKSPAYRLNAHELSSAMSEGVGVYDNFDLEEICIDSSDRVSNVILKNNENEKIKIQAKTVLIAIGSKPNVAYSFEHPNVFVKSSGYYTPYDINNTPFDSGFDKNKYMFTSYNVNDKRISFVGDLHPNFNGSVVKALASAKSVYKEIRTLLLDKSSNYYNFKPFNMPVVKEIDYLTKNIIRIVIYSPFHVKNIKCGHIFKLQNLIPPLVEPISVVVFDHDDEKISFLLDLSNITSLVLSRLNVGDNILLMGPSGVRLNVDDPREVNLVISDKHGYLSAISYINQLKKSHLKVYLLIDNSLDLNLLKTLVGDIDGITLFDYKLLSIKYLRSLDLPWQIITRVLVYAESDFLAMIKSLKQEFIHEDLNNGVKKWLGSVNGSVQCMLKGVCASCWQWQIDPLTGERTKVVFSCSWQDQPLEIIDLAHLYLRERKNVLQKLTHMFLSYF